MPYIQIQGGRLHYQLDGPENAPPIVLSNSLGTSLGMWEPQMPALTRSFRVLRYDTRGHGLSDPIAGPYTIDLLGGDVIALLDHLGIDRAHFCGLSLGGLTGQWLGINAGQRLNRLVLCNTAARVGTVEAWNTRIATVRQGGMESMATAILERWYTPGFVARSPEAIETTRKMLLHSSVTGYVGCSEALRDADLIAEVERIGVPTLVIAGTHDPATPPEQGRFLAGKIADARYVELPASHLSNIEAAGEFNAALVAFLSEREVN